MLGVRRILVGGAMAQAKQLWNNFRIFWPPRMSRGVCIGLIRAICGRRCTRKHSLVRISVIDLCRKRAYQDWSICSQAIVPADGTRLVLCLRKGKGHADT